MSTGQRVLDEALGLGAQGLRMAQTRLEILGVDLQREKEALTRQLVYGLTCGISAALAAFSGILWVALSFEPRTRFIVLGVTAGVFLLIALVTGIIFYKRLQNRERLFANIIETLKRDSEALDPRRTHEAS